MKKYLVFFCLLGLTFLFFDPSVADEDSSRPFWGRWEGEWSLGSSGQFGTRKCILSAYIENGEAYVDYYLGGFYHPTSRRTSPAIEKKKIKAEVKTISGVATLVFPGTWPASNDYYWNIEKDRLVGRPASQSWDDVCTLKRTK